MEEAVDRVLDLLVRGRRSEHRARDAADARQVEVDGREAEHLL